MNLKAQVEHCLKTYPQTRNDDKILVPAVWSLFHVEHIARVDNEQYVKLKDIVLLPSPESITRVRRKFQEEGLYPASDYVRRRRDAQKERWRQEMGKSLPEIVI